MSWKRISLKRINQALKNQKDETILQKLKVIKKIYIVGVVSFWILVTWAFYLIYLGAKK